MKGLTAHFKNSALEMSKKLSKEIAVITGGNSGIRLATAKRFAAADEMANVVLLLTSNESSNVTAITS